MTTLLVTAAFIVGAALLRYSVIAAARRGVAWDDECRSRLRDRQWAAVAAKWTTEVLRRT
jgi:hypothetical protein